LDIDQDDDAAWLCWLTDEDVDEDVDEGGESSNPKARIRLIRKKKGKMGLGNPTTANPTTKGNPNPEKGKGRHDLMANLLLQGRNTPNKASVGDPIANTDHSPGNSSASSPSGLPKLDFSKLHTADDKTTNEKTAARERTDRLRVEEAEKEGAVALLTLAGEIWHELEVEITDPR